MSAFFLRISQKNADFAYKASCARRMLLTRKNERRII